MVRRPIGIAAVLLAAVPLSLLAQAGTLRVIRTTPSNNDATITSRITVSFDRPVAGSLDRSVDASRLVHIEPALAGKAEWRDPVTIRFTPTERLAPGATYDVTIANSFTAMDGSALSQPYHFTFRVHGPILLVTMPFGSGREPQRRRIVPGQQLQLVYSSPVDLARISRAAYVEPLATCGGADVIHLTATSQRPVRDKENWEITQAGGYSRDRAVDSLRRVVQLVSASPLPRGCGGTLVVPAEATDQPSRDPIRYAFDTYGDFRVDSVACGEPGHCPTGPVRVVFSTPVRGGEVLRRLHLLPAVKFSVNDTMEESTRWFLDAKLRLHTNYALVVDTAIRDVMGQRMIGNPAMAFRTTGYDPMVRYAYGRQVVERVGFRSLAVEHVNVDTLIVSIAQVPRALEAKALGMVSSRGDSLWSALKRTTTEQRIPVKSIQDSPMITGVRLPTLNAMRPDMPTLLAIRVGARAGNTKVELGPTSLVQVTDLGVHVRMGIREASVWVTGVSDGSVKSGAAVTVHNNQGKVIAKGVTNAEGLARLTGLQVQKDTVVVDRGDGEDEEEGGGGQFEGFVSVALGTDRALAAVNSWDPDLSPYHFNVSGAEGDERHPVAGAVFTERGIYRPGERVLAKAIVRNGMLGALRAMDAGDSVRWIFHDREGAVVRQATTSLSAYGTADQAYAVSSSAPVGQYTLRAARRPSWRMDARGGDVIPGGGVSSPRVSRRPVLAGAHADAR